MPAPLARIRPRVDRQYASRDWTLLTTGLDGFIAEGTDQGLFAHKTRLLSRYRYRIDDQVPVPVVLSNVEQHSWLGYYLRVAPGIAHDTGSDQVLAAPQQSLELRLSRVVGPGLHEDVDLTNFTPLPARFDLILEVDADFADHTEVNGSRQQHGRLTRDWWPREDAAGELRFEYTAEHAGQHDGERGVARPHRSLVLRIDRASSSAFYAEGAVVFPVELAPHGRWHACVLAIPVIDGTADHPPDRCRVFAGESAELERRRRVFLTEATRFSTAGSDTLAPIVVGAVEQAKRDLSALRLYEFDRGDRAWTLAPGLPRYLALFGHDTLTAAWQTALASPALMRGTLLELARWQGRRVDDWRDEQPGRMLREAHAGPLEVLQFPPRGRYAGLATTSAFYPLVVSELWHWTGDAVLVRPLAEIALRALRWLDEGGDLDGDGFYEYQTRSSRGVKNQGWKDSGDALVYPDGSQVEPPIATCEEQGFVYVAKLRLSEVLWWLGWRDDARRLYHEATELKKRFNEAYWNADDGFLAMALDAAKRPVRSVGSNPGHCLATGIVDETLARRMAARLLAEDLFSGWGIRTLSSDHPVYDPYSYRRGSVWPVEQGTFALGFVRYGLHEAVERLARAQFEAAALFDFYRLPELFSGHPRDADHPFPALDPRANSPQAWSASAVFCLLQSLLGLYPYAPLHVLLLDPHLPAWLPELTVEGLRVGQGRVSIRFVRQADGTTDYRILDVRGRCHVLRQPSPWSLTASFPERVKDVLTSLLPGR